MKIKQEDWQLKISSQTVASKERNKNKEGKQKKQRRENPLKSISRTFPRIDEHEFQTEQANEHIKMYPHQSTASWNFRTGDTDATNF